MSTPNLEKALELMQDVPKRANDAMTLSMICGYDGNIHAQGQIILQVCRSPCMSSPCVSSPCVSSHLPLCVLPPPPVCPPTSPCVSSHLPLCVFPLCVLPPPPVCPPTSPCVSSPPPPVSPPVHNVLVAVCTGVFPSKHV